MNIEYGTVLDVYNTDEKGAQLVDVAGHLTDKTYTECELLSFRGQTAIPEKGNIVIFVQLHNRETVVLGVIEQCNLGLSETETLIHNGVKGTTFKRRTGIKITKEFDIEIDTLDENSTVRSSVKLKNDHEIELKTLDSAGVLSSSVELKQDGTIAMEAPVRVDITSPLVNII